MEQFKVSFLVILATSLIGLSCSLDLESVSEGECLASPKLATNVDQKWMSTAKLDYMTGGSKLDLFNLVSGHPDFASLRDFEFYYDGCITIDYFDLPGQRAAISSFGGNSSAKSTKITFLEDGVMDIEIETEPGKEESQVIRHYTSFTDNKSFVVFETCLMKRNRRTWAVLSTGPVLSKEAQKQIEDHVVSLGFHKDKIIFSRRETCCDKKKKEEKKCSLS